MSYENSQGFSINTGSKLATNDANLLILPVDENGSYDREVQNMLISQDSFKGFSYQKVRDFKGRYDPRFKRGEKPVLAVFFNSNNYNPEGFKNNISSGIGVMYSMFGLLTVWLPVDAFRFRDESLGDCVNRLTKIFEEFSLKGYVEKTVLSLSDSKEAMEYLDSKQEELKNDPLKLGGERFFLVGSYWDGAEKSYEFFEKGIWQNGYEDRFVEDVNSVKRGDYLILKSSFQQGGKAVLRVKAVGRVLSNLQNGRDLEVEWYQLERFKDFPDYGYYRKTIQEPNLDDVKLFLEALFIEQEELRIWMKNEIEPDNLDKVAGLHPDSPLGEDLLDFESDIKVLAQLMTYREVVPPLAIGLFGSWGSGKSFFMEKLYDRVRLISENSNQKEPFCTGVAQIRFNAWSYLDTNLWAGLITKIFDGLFEYISENTKGENEKREVEEKIKKELTVAKAEIASIESKKAELNSELDDVLARKASLSAVLGSKQEALKTKARENVLEGLESFVSEKLSENEINQLDKVRSLATNVSKASPIEVYKQLKSGRVFIIELLTGCRISWRFGIAIISFISVGALTFVWSDYKIPGLSASFLTAAIAISQRVSDSLAKLRPLWSRFSSLKTDYEKEKTKLESEAAVEKDALNEQIKCLRKELERTQESVIELKSSISTLEYRADNLLATEALYSFIEERSKGQTYKKFYGIISLIRDDFEILSNLFVQHQDEQKKADEEQFRKLFKKPLERIVLYIDDLDRCKEEQVLKVLEAVNLLLAYPLFVVVVGVDPRWVKNALIKEHHGQFGFYDKSLAHEDLVAMDPANYLEKIFQVPFHLQKTSDDAIKGLLAKLTPVHEVRQEKEVAQPNSNIEATSIQEVAERKLGKSIRVTMDEERSKTLPQSMALEPLELEIMQELSEIIGPNPRAIKRFVNVYLIIRAHDYRLKMTQSKEEEYLIMQFLLALCIGPYKCLVDALEHKIGIGPGLSLEGFFNHDFGEKTHLKRPMSLYLADLAEILGHSKRLKVLLRKVEMSHVYQHYKFIRRFTFRDLRPELDFE